MKKTHAVPRKTNALTSLPSSRTPDEDEENQQEDSQSFSTERITARASVTTDVLKEILAREDTSSELRYWGINE